MKPWRQKSDRLPALLLAVALIPACAGDPPFEVDPNRSDEGRVELGTSSLAERDYDARARLNAGLAVDESAARSRLTGRFASNDIAASFDPATGVTRTLMSRTSFLTDARAGSPEAIAQTSPAPTAACSALPRRTWPAWS